MIDCFYRCADCKETMQKKGRKCTKCGSYYQETYYYNLLGEVHVEYTTYHGPM